MADKFMKKAIISQIDRLSDDVVDMWIDEKEIALAARPGQFVSLYCKDGSRLLPRPISICEIDRGAGKLRLVYRIVGAGTKEFSDFAQGDTIDVMGPLGNGFTLEGEKVLLIGGGIGIPPMLELSKALSGQGKEVQMVLGYRDALFLNKEFESFGKVYIATEDGCAGCKGNVIDAINENKLEADVIFACGPTPMLRGVKAYGEEKNIKTQISMEERMACGIGACLACVCKSKEVDHHTNVNNKRICKDGPVFYIDDVEL